MQLLLLGPLLPLAFPPKLMQLMLPMLLLLLLPPKEPLVLLLVLVLGNCEQRQQYGADHQWEFTETHSVSSSDTTDTKFVL